MRIAALDRRFSVRSGTFVLMIAFFVAACAPQSSQVKKSDFKNKGAKKLFAHGASYEKEKKYDMAIFHYGLSIGLEPTPLALVKRGKLLSGAEQYDEALADFNKAISTNHRYVEAYLYRGDLWIKQKEYGKALDDFNMAIEVDPASAHAYNHRGLFNWIYAKDYPEAFKDFTKSIELDPKIAENYLDRAGVRKLLGQDTTMVIEDLSKAIEHNRYYKKAYFVRAIEHVIHDNVYAARIDFMRVLQMDKDESIYTPIASGYLALGEIKEGLTRSKHNIKPFEKKAIKLLDDAIGKMNKFSPQDVRIIWSNAGDDMYALLRSQQYSFRAMAKLALDDYPAAMEDISFALILKPGDKLALDLKEKTVRLMAGKKE